MSNQRRGNWHKASGAEFGASQEMKLLQFFKSAGISNYTPGVDNSLLIQKGLSPQRISLHGRCMHAVYIAHCIIRRSRETGVSEDSVRQILWAAFKRGGNG